MRQLSRLILELAITLHFALLFKLGHGFYIEPKLASTRKKPHSITSSNTPHHGLLQTVCTIRSSVILKITEEDDPGVMEELTIFRGDGDEQLSDEMWEDLESGQPPQWLVVKELLGISAITYVLAAAIVVSLGLNFLLGPGWLGQAIGLSGTGSFTETSASLPQSLDLSDPAYLL